MTSLSLASKLQRLLWLSIFWAALFIAAAFLFPDFPIASIVIGCSMIAYLIIAGGEVRRSLLPLAALGEVLQEASKGHFEQRMAVSNEDSELGQISWALNDMLDQLEAQSREIATALAFASRGEYYRKAFPGGLLGGFAVNIVKINESLTVTETSVQEVRDQQAYLAGEVERIGGLLNALRHKDLSQRLQAMKDDSIGELIGTLNGTIGDLASIMRNLRSSSGEVAGTSAEIAASAEEISVTIQSQSAQIEEVVAAIEEMTAAVTSTAESTTEADRLSKDTVEMAEQGRSAVDETVSGMQRIAELVEQSQAVIKRLGDSSRAIGEVTKVIEDIADQTNLLALNASIEAARAGEAGKGFAVVADEVRKLAERTQSATSEIAETIGGIQSETAQAVKATEAGAAEAHSGIQLAQDAGAALERIVSGIKNVEENITIIATASEEQSTTSTEIARTVELIASGSRENMTAVQDIAQAIGELNGQAENLDAMAAEFKLEGGQDREQALLNNGRRELVQGELS